MSALMIKDLSVTEQLDSKAMKTVRGGFFGDPSFPSLFLNLDSSKRITAPQFIQQEMNINNYSADSVSTKIMPMMSASNNIQMQ